MRAVTFQAPGEVRVTEKPEPEVGGDDEAVVQVEASGICGSDLHIYHGRVKIDPGFTLGHEYVGTIVAAGPNASVFGEHFTAEGRWLVRLRSADASPVFVKALENCWLTAVRARPTSAGSRSTSPTSATSTTGRA